MWRLWVWGDWALGWGGVWGGPAWAEHSVEMLSSSSRKRARRTAAAAAGASATLIAVEGDISHGRLLQNFRERGSLVDVTISSGDGMDLQAHRLGYSQLPNRKALFPWNANVDAWLDEGTSLRARHDAVARFFWLDTFLGFARLEPLDS